MILQEHGLGLQDVYGGGVGIYTLFTGLALRLSWDIMSPGTHEREAEMIGEKKVLAIRIGRAWMESIRPCPLGDSPQPKMVLMDLTGYYCPMARAA